MAGVPAVSVSSASISSVVLPHRSAGARFDSWAGRLTCFGQVDKIWLTSRGVSGYARS